MASTLLLMAGFAPCANADLIDYFNFEDGLSGGARFAVFVSSDSLGFVHNLMECFYNRDDIRDAFPGIDLNVAPGDKRNNNHALQLSNTVFNSPTRFLIPLKTPNGSFSNMILTFAYDNYTNEGFDSVTLSFSTDGGHTFTTGPTTQMFTGSALITLPVPAAANNAPALVLQLEFRGGSSTGPKPTTAIDNIQINGMIAH